MLALVCYVGVLLAGQLPHHHAHGGSRLSESHCAVCACLKVPIDVSAVEPPPLVFSDVGGLPSPLPGSAPTRDLEVAAGRAPPVLSVPAHRFTPAGVERASGPAAGRV